MLIFFDVLVSSGKIYAQNDSSSYFNTLVLIKRSDIKPDSLSTYSASYPQPSAPTTKFCIDIPEACRLIISIYDAKKMLKNAYDSDVQPGQYLIDLYSLNFLKNFSSGVYYLKVKAGEKIMQKKFFFVK